MLVNVQANLEEQELAEVLDDLKRRVSDWRGLTPDQWGKLVLFENLPVRKHDITRNVGSINS